MEKGLYTYDYVGNNKVKVRYSNETDLECDTFDSVESIINQMEKENTEVEIDF